MGPDTFFRHVARSRAATVDSLYELKPKAVLSYSAVLRQVFFGLPGLRFPSGAYVNAFPWIHSEDVADERPAPPEDLLTNGADVSPVSPRSMF